VVFISDPRIALCCRLDTWRRRISHELQLRRGRLYLSVPCFSNLNYSYISWNYCNTNEIPEENHTQIISTIKLSRDWWLWLGKVIDKIQFVWIFNLSVSLEKWSEKCEPQNPKTCLLHGKQNVEFVLILKKWKWTRRVKVSILSVRQIRLIATPCELIFIRPCSDCICDWVIPFISDQIHQML
jgi:hypothetical protein